MKRVNLAGFLAAAAALAAACNGQIEGVGPGTGGEPSGGGSAGSSSGGSIAVASGGTNFEAHEVLQCHTVSLGSDGPGPDDACRTEDGGYLPCGSPCIPECGYGGEGGQAEQCPTAGQYACDRGEHCVLVL